MHSAITFKKWLSDTAVEFETAQPADIQTDIPSAPDQCQNGTENAKISYKIKVERLESYRSSSPYSDSVEYIDVCNEPVLLTDSDDSLLNDINNKTAVTETQEMLAKMLCSSHSAPSSIEASVMSNKNNTANYQVDENTKPNTQCESRENSSDVTDLNYYSITRNQHISLRTKRAGITVI